jgi:hypothetical protein
MGATQSVSNKVYEMLQIRLRSTVAKTQKQTYLNSFPIGFIKVRRGRRWSCLIMSMTPAFSLNGGLQTQMVEKALTLIDHFSSIYQCAIIGRF